MFGAFVGNKIGAQLDEKDKILMANATARALEYTPSGHNVPWDNPDTQHSGLVIPTRTYKDTTTHRYCREYTQEVFIGGHKEIAYGHACRQPNGDWEIQSKAR